MVRGAREYVVSLQFHDLTIREVVAETRDSRTFVLDVPDSLRAQFEYQAGQFLTFEVPWGDFKIRRCYSLSSCPGEGPPRVTVKRVEGGRVSNWMIDTLRAGDRISVSPPDGRFTLAADRSEAPLTLYAGGSGITPILSLIEFALRRTERAIALLYANRARTDVIFFDALEKLEAEHPERLGVQHHLDDPEGLISEQRIADFARGREAGDHYVCGPAPFMDLVEAVLARSGVDPHRVHFERFNSPLDPDRRPPDQVVQTAETEVPESFLLRLGGQIHTVPYERGLTLLAAARRQGLPAPSSCEDGYCSSCLGQLVAGDVAMRSCKALTERDVERGRLLLCQALPTSATPVEIDLDAVSFRAPAAGGATQASLAVRWVTGVLVLVLLAVLLFVKSRA